MPNTLVNVTDALSAPPAKDSHSDSISELRESILRGRAGERGFTLEEVMADIDRELANAELSELEK